MVAGLAIISILGGALSVLVVGPHGLLATLATISLGGCLATLVVAALGEWARASSGREERTASSPASAPGTLARSPASPFPTPAARADSPVEPV